jgi:hypothetical protein
MKFHTPKNQSLTPLPVFAVRNNTLVHAKKVFLKRDYPNLPYDMVKIMGQNGKNVYLPLSKVSAADY